MGDAAHQPQPPKIEPPLGMYPGRLDDRGRVKMPANFLQYFGALGETRFFVTSLDRRIAQIYTIPAWRETEKWLANFRADAKAARNVAFNAADLGAEADLDNQGRILFSTELRRELGIENQPVRLYAYRGHIEILSDKIYQERRSEASANPVDDVTKLDEAGLP
jgi:MraZ protein